MSFLSNLHTHTPYCDGKNTIEEYVLKAIDLGFLSVGISEHGPAVYPESGILEENIEVYLKEIEDIKEKYRGKIEVYGGFEVDNTRLISKQGLDYTIGSVHFAHNKKSGKYHILDYLPEMFEEAIGDFGGILNLVEFYFAENIDLALNYRPDILGHIEILLKLNGENNNYFNPKERWYRKIAENAVDKIGDSGCIVEVSTGLISRGYSESTCPNEDTLHYMLKKNIPVTISSDAHCAENLSYAFSETEQLLKDIGYKKVKLLKDGGFTDMWL